MVLYVVVLTCDCIVCVYVCVGWGGGCFLLQY
jgi:hypothetical protein